MSRFDSRTREFDQAAYDALYKDYVESGLSLEELANKYGLKDPTEIPNMLRRHGYATVYKRPVRCKQCGQMYYGRNNSKWCSDRCRRDYEKFEEEKINLPHQTQIIILARKAKKCGMSYGQYVAQLKCVKR